MVVGGNNSGLSTKLIFSYLEFENVCHASTLLQAEKLIVVFINLRIEMDLSTSIINRGLVLIALLAAMRARAQHDSTIRETGIASFYAKKFEGRRCSSGDRFCNDSLTAAHKTLKFGTRVKVTNLKNDSMVIVRINDRLPQWSKRKIDLSRAAATRCSFRWVTPPAE